MHKHSIDRVDLLKLDAEQSEEAILAGIAEEDWPKIRQIVVEVHGGESATRNLADMFARRGFRTSTDCNVDMPTLGMVYGVRTS